MRLIGATALLLLAVAPAAAQQYGSVGTSVTVDYGVLDSLGAGGPNLPGMLSGGYPQGAPYAYGAAPGAYPPAGQLLAPPAAAPRSSLTAQQPGLTAAAGPGAAAPIKLIPPSEFKKKVAATPPSAPAPAPPAQAAVEPPPPPTPVEPAPAAPSAPAVPMPEAPAAANTTEGAAPAPQAAAEPPPPAPPPVPEPAPAPEPAATQPEPPAPEPPSEPDTTPAPETEMAAAEPSVPAEAEAAAQPPAAEETQQAALPPPETVEGQVSVTFAEGVSELSDEAKSALDGVAERLRGDETLRIQLLAYAQAIDDNTSRARRMSLSRALAVRSYLIEKGVRSTRMDVRALGSNVEGEPADRVDIIPQAQ